jgi:4,5-epoxidase
LSSGGIAVTVIDKAARPVTTSRALGLRPRGREILARLNALGNLPKRSVHACATNVRLRQRLLTKFVVHTERGEDALGSLLISQAEIEAQLRRRLGAINGEYSIRTRWPVGCDGAHSAVRSLMGVDFEGRPFPETWILADVELTEKATIWRIGSGSARLRRGGSQQSRWAPSNSRSVMRQ